MNDSLQKQKHSLFPNFTWLAEIQMDISRSIQGCKHCRLTNKVEINRGMLFFFFSGKAYYWSALRLERVEQHFLGIYSAMSVKP